MNDPTKSNDRLPENGTTLHADVAADVTQAAVLREPNYDAFGEWMDGELEKLVARWVHLAAPNASRSFRRNFAG
jgi:hypothetical protein